MGKRKKREVGATSLTRLSLSKEKTQRRKEGGGGKETDVVPLFSNGRMRSSCFFS